MNKYLRTIIPLIICLLMFSSSFSNQILQVPDEKEPLQVDARSTACISDVCLSELLVNAQGGSETGAVSSTNWANAEWVELHNSGPNTVDLTDWKLRDNMNREMILDVSRIVFPQGASDMNLLSGEYMIVARNGDGGSCGFCLSNDGATYTRSASLIDESGNSVHEATWSYYVSEGVTLIENPADPLADWVESNQLTPGASNGNATVSESVVCEDICVNEVLPNPIGNDTQDWPNGEWVEIYNNGTIPVNLSGWAMTLDSGDSTNNLLDLDKNFDAAIEEDWILNPGEYLVLGLNDSDNFGLRNNADELTIRRPNGSVAHTAEWFSAPSGISLVEPSQTTLNHFWVRPPYMTPGWENPTNLQDSVNATSDLKINEVLAYHDSSNGFEYPNGEWVEIFNSGDSAIDLNGWEIRNGTWKTMQLTDHLVSGTNETGFIESGEYAILGNHTNFLIQNLYEVLWLITPDESVVQAIHWNSSSMGLGLIEDENGTIDDPWISFMPTPGAPNVEPPPDYDDNAEFIISKIFTEGKTNSNSCASYIEIKNFGEVAASLHGWKLSFNGERIDGFDSSTDGNDELVFADISINAGNSIILGMGSSDVQNYLLSHGGVEAYYWWNMIINTDQVDQPDNEKTCINQESLISLENPNSTYVDAVALPDSSPPIEGWSGPAINLPSSISNEPTIVFIRGDGCEDLPDTNSSSDWENSWSKFGRSTHCDFESEILSNAKIIPMLGPSDGLYQIINWINSAQSSLHVHMYEFTSLQLANSLISAVERGVDVTLVIEKYPYSNYDLSTTRGIVYELDKAGVQVIWFTTGTPEAPQPYAYNHAKAAVKDGQEIWLGSGNFKDSSFPNRQQWEVNGETILWGEEGNREWGVFVNSSEMATKLLSRMAWDENIAHPHVESYDPNEPQYDKPDSWSGLPTSNLPMDPPLYSIPEYEGDIEAKLLSCPDDCANSIISSIDNSNSSILLSLQYLDLDWWHGWSDESNPWGDSLVVGALERAAERGVSIRLIINEYYADESPEVQQATNLFNEVWNHTYGYDTAAIMMSGGDGILKLHNKGMIVDSESVLIGSMNWGSNSLLQNREYGIMITHHDFAQYYIESWLDDWNRLDLWTDTDGDGLPDHWEVGFGLNRTTSIIPGTAITEHSYDPDSDGLNNLEEYNNGGDPLSPDTDGDCISDLLELAFAQSEGISARKAMSNSDANGNGIDDGNETECGANLEEVDVDTTTDTDGDGVVDINDDCPNTPEEFWNSLNIDGCPLDSDSDGIYDYDNSGEILDLCSDTPKNTIVDSNGCELISEEDIDNDGVIDSEDSCLDTPQGAIVDSNGCSDSDNDGVIDSIDECPETLPGSTVGSTGCTPSQEKINDEQEDENRLGNGAAADDAQSLLLLGLMSFAAIAFIGSLLIFFMNKQNSTNEVFADLENEIVDSAAKGLEEPELNESGTSAFTSPVLDAVTGKTTSEDEHRKAVFSSPVLNAGEVIKYDENDESIDMPGWTRDVIEAYLAQGWTMEQLKEWYNENS